jgi:hypothetical protein
MLENKIISTFMDEPFEWYDHWQGLMRIVSKIESLESQKFGRFIVQIYDDCCTIQATNRTKENTYSKLYCSKDKKNSVYQSILLFLEWYNKYETK